MTACDSLLDRNQCCSHQPLTDMWTTRNQWVIGNILFIQPAGSARGTQTPNQAAPKCRGTGFLSPKPLFFILFKHASLFFFFWLTVNPQVDCASRGTEAGSLLWECYVPMGDSRAVIFSQHIRKSRVGYFWPVHDWDTCSQNHTNYIKAEIAPTWLPQHIHTHG